MMDLTRVSAVSLLRDYSLEITAKDVAGLELAAPLIPAGSAVSITYLTGETMPARVSAAAALRRLGLVPVPHISARRLASASDLKDFLARLAGEAGIDQAFVIAGDCDVPAGPYQDALAVIRSGLLQDFGVRGVGIAGHPEGHPQIGEAQLWQALSDKIALLDQLGLSCEIVSQFAFDEAPILTWLSRLRAMGITVPVRIGLPGPASASTLLRFAARCGVGASAKVMAKYGVSMVRLFNTAGPDRLVEALVDGLQPAQHGQVGVHLYPFGGVVRTAKWAQGSRLSGAKSEQSVR